MISDIKNGEVRFQPTEIHNTSTDLKDVVPLEMSNINMNDDNVMALGFDSTVVMQILSSSMYKDKLIPFQEVVANSRDAIIRRKEAGDVFTPEVLINIDMKNHEATIKDNGCGMDKEVVNSVYRIYGRSNKRESVNEAGQFGIGAKSVFSLVDEYSVSTVSMLTHKKLEFIVTKRAILITQDETPTEEEPGTTIKFTVPEEYDRYSTIEDKIKRTVRKWNCPVYIMGTEKSGFVNSKSLVSAKASEDITTGNYNLESYKLKHIGKDYTFFLSQRERYSDSKPKMYIGHIPYDFQYEFPSDLNVIIHNPNIITLSATREGLIKDAKHDELLKNISKDILEMLTPEFEKYFKHLPTILGGRVEIDEQIMTIFQNMISKDLINVSDYPFYEILMTNIKYSYLYSKSNSSLRSVLKHHYPVLYTTRKQLNSDRIEPVLEQLKRTFNNEPALIYLPDACSGFCLHCPSYNLNSKCDQKKEPINTMTTLFQEIVIPRATSATPRRTGGLTATRLYDNKTIRISASEKDDYVYTSTAFKTNERKIVLVSEKKLATLISEDLKVINNPAEYLQQRLNEIYVEDINDVKISAGLLKNYTHIITGAEMRFKPILDMFYPNYLLLKDDISDEVLKTLPTTQTRFKMYDIEDQLEKINDGTKLKICFEVSPSDSINVLRNTSYNTYAKNMVITKISPVVTEENKSCTT